MPITCKAIGNAQIALSYRSVSVTEQVNRDLGILFCFELALKCSGRTDVWHQFASDKLQWLSKSTGESTFPLDAHSADDQNSPTLKTACDDPF
jgi:hypothetical protein